MAILCVVHGIHPPMFLAQAGDAAPRNILRKYNKDGTPGRIVVSREELFDSIDDWHTKNGHLGQERTWKYCRNKYANVTQDHVKFYCTTCFVCMKKNPVTKNEKGSRKPIFSKNWRDRFQVDLVDFCKQGSVIPLVS